MIILYSECSNSPSHLLQQTQHHPTSAVSQVTKRWNSCNRVSSVGYTNCGTHSRALTLVKQTVQLTKKCYSSEL